MSITVRQTSIETANQVNNQSKWCQNCGQYNVRDELNCPICGSFFPRLTSDCQQNCYIIHLEVITMEDEKKELSPDQQVEISETDATVEVNSEKEQVEETSQAPVKSSEIDQLNKFKEELLQIVSSVSEFTKSQLNELKRANEEGRFDNIKQGAKNIGEGAVKYAEVAGGYIKDSSITASKWVTNATRKGLTETQEYIEALQKKAKENYLYDPERYPELTNLCQKLVLFSDAIRWLGYVLIFIAFISGLTMFTGVDKPLVIIGRFFIMLLLTLTVLGLHELFYNFLKALPEFLSMMHRIEINSKKALEQTTDKQEYDY